MYMAKNNFLLTTQILLWAKMKIKHLGLPKNHV